ncbi:MAG: glucose-6-phosphate dehydrogenase [Actinomycetota bacterium]|nr:glucose-6-phosphate dehydrogenase [Actinomycetota bacterium]
MIEKLVLFGATGDLAGRFLLPALAALQATGKLADGFEVIGAAREELDDAAFRRAAADRLEEHAADTPAPARDAVVRTLRYRPVEIGDARSVGPLFANGDPPAAAYLALPPSLFPAAVTALAEVGLPAGSRIALEKPFGEDLESAVELNRLLARAAGGEGEQAVFRVDHVLGMATVQNMLAMRLGNPVLEAAWNGRHVERVEILWEETLALEGRAGYYDTAGALKDVLQNHMLQVLALIAMEPPATSGERDLHDRKLDALRAIQPLSRAEIASRTRRARYTAGRLSPPPEGSGEIVPAYADEDGVDPRRKTETFAEVVLELEGERWRGTPFLLRAGKALGRRRKMAVLRFSGAAAGKGGELQIGLDGPEEITLRLTGGAPGSPVPLALTAPPPAGDLPPYGHVLLDVLTGGSALSVRGDEAEQAWRAVTPVLEAWSENLVPLEEYPAGSAGPGLRDEGRQP